MKKVISLVLSIVICFSAICLITACDKETKSDLTTINSSLTAISNQTSTTSTLLNQQMTNNESDVGGGVITVQKYRHRFYSVPEPFISLVDRNAYFEWENTIDITSTAETMVMSQFIQHFGITREQFDKANLEWAKIIKDKLFGVPCINPKDYANQEDDEIYNADIIFTFDDDLIREYYLSPDYPYLYDIEFEETVEKGEYTSQTEEWVDVEAMEAEIIAKYGEVEIVVETETVIQEETTATDSPKSEITEQTKKRLFQYETAV